MPFHADFICPLFHPRQWKHQWRYLRGKASWETGQTPDEIIDFQIQDAESLSFADNTFDVVVARNLFWPLVHPGRALDEWRRVMKPGGRLIVSDGLWYNTTWKRLPRLVLKALMDCCRSGRSTGIFCHDRHALIMGWWGLKTDCSDTAYITDDKN
jgi:SAM-dependent methyltransferase